MKSLGLSLEEIYLQLIQNEQAEGEAIEAAPAVEEEPKDVKEGSDA
jgi:hypothetical protein